MLRWKIGDGEWRPTCWSMNRTPLNYPPIPHKSLEPNRGLVWWCLSSVMEKTSRWLGARIKAARRLQRCGWISMVSEGRACFRGQSAGSRSGRINWSVWGLGWKALRYGAFESRGICVMCVFHVSLVGSALPSFVLSVCWFWREPHSLSGSIEASPKPRVPAPRSPSSAQPRLPQRMDISPRKRSWGRWKEMHNEEKMQHTPPRFKLDLHPGFPPTPPSPSILPYLLSPRWFYQPAPLDWRSPRRNARTRIKMRALVVWVTERGEVNTRGTQCRMRRPNWGLHLTGNPCAQVIP